MPEPIKPGIYRHFKTKNDYIVWGVGENTEEKYQHFVVYARLDEPDRTKFWLRPEHMFLERVPDPETGALVPRFAFVRGNPDQRLARASD